MAQRRMFNKTVTNSDNFLEMPDSSQNLYFHLSMNADDDGFVDNWKSIMRMTGHKEDDLKVLIAKQYIIPFESGVIVIRHWRLNNYLQKDRITPTNYQKELSQLSVENGNVYNLYTGCIHSIDKYSIDKYSINNNSEEQKEKFNKPTLEEIEEYCKSRNNDVNAKQFYDYYEINNWKDNKGNKVKNWKQKVITWEGRKKKTNDLIDTPDWFDKDIKSKELSEKQKEEIDKLMEDFK